MSIGVKGVGAVSEGVRAKDQGELVAGEDCGEG